MLCHADVVHGCGIRLTLTLSGIVLNDVEIVQTKGTRKSSETAMSRT
jgi:hypothetical protein